MRTILTIATALLFPLRLADMAASTIEIVVKQKGSNTALRGRCALPARNITEWWVCDEILDWGRRVRWLLTYSVLEGKNPAACREGNRDSSKRLKARLCRWVRILSLSTKKSCSLTLHRRIRIQKVVGWHHIGQIPTTASRTKIGLKHGRWKDQHAELNRRARAHEST